MSLETHTSVAVMPDPHGSGHVQAEPDVHSVKPIFVTLALVVVVFLIGIFWAYRVQRREEASLNLTTDESPRILTYASQYEVGIINQQQFVQETRAVETHEAGKERLGSYGWVDREKQLVHLPIELGMEKVVAGQAKERK